MNCPDCHNELKQGQNSCLCGYRLKPKKPVHTCAKCDESENLKRCGPDSAPYFLCTDHWDGLMESLEEAKAERKAIQTEPDYLQDKADGVIK